MSNKKKFFLSWIFFQSLGILEFIWKAQGFSMKVRARTVYLCLKISGKCVWKDEPSPSL